MITLLPGRQGCAEKVPLIVTVCLALVAVFGMATSLYLFYPGALTPDSVSSLEEARSNTYGYWHPPAFAFLWRLLLTFFPAQTGMLYLSVFLYWASFAIIEALLIGERRFVHTIFIFVVSFLPSFFIQLGEIWTDIVLSHFMLFGFALLFLAEKTNRRTLTFFSLVVIILK